MGNHISWLHLLIHSHSQLVFRCWSTQDNCPCCILCFTARSFSYEVLFFDYIACSHIKYSAALLLPWAWKKTQEVISYIPVQIHLNDIFFIPNSWYSCSNLEFCLVPQTLYWDFLTFIPKTYCGEGWRSSSILYPQNWQSPYQRSKYLLSPDVLLSSGNIYLIADGENWFNMIVLL